MAGYTTSQTLPGTANAFQPAKAAGYPDNRDVFVAKFSPSGTALLWATFLGGDGDDMPVAVAMDAVGGIYVVGTTNSTTFPATPGAYLLSAGPGFAAKISADGRSLLYSTYLPGAPTGVALNVAGEAFIAGTFGPSVITGGALGASASSAPEEYNGVYLLRLNSSGTALVFGAYLRGGGFNGSVATSVAVDAQGNSYVAGFTAESNLLTTANALQAQYSNPGTRIPCCSNGYIAEVSPTGSQLLYGTYFGPKYSGTAIASLVVAPDGSLYFSGTTNTTTQATPGAYLGTPGTPFAGFIAKLTIGRQTLDSFSYVPSFPSSPEGPYPLQLPVLLGIGNQPETVYATFETSTGGFSVIELSIPTLSLLSSFAPPSLGFTPSGSALASPHSLGLVGGCGPCSVGNLISANAFQATPQNSSSSAVLIQITDESLTINSVVNAASYLGGPVSPGEIVTISGTGLGPTTPAGLALDQTGKVATSLGGVQVWFSGIPAPLTYVSATQVNCVVPYEIQGLVSPYVQVGYQGQTSTVFPLTPAATAPALFTANGSGSGPVVQRPSGSLEPGQ